MIHRHLAQLVVEVKGLTARGVQSGSRVEESRPVRAQLGMKAHSCVS